MPRSKSDSATSMLSRVIAATVGGFVFASAAIVALSYLLPGIRVQAVIGASLTGFVFCVAAVVWTFAARTPLRAWAGLAIGTAISAGITLLARIVWP